MPGEVKDMQGDSNDSNLRLFAIGLFRQMLSGMPVEEGRSPCRDDPGTPSVDEQSLHDDSLSPSTIVDRPVS